jgi:hypothetical protein
LKNFLSTVILLSCATVSLAQPCVPPPNRASIRITNVIGERETLWLGFHPSATYGLDLSLCEFEIPHVPVPNLDVCFVNIPGREGWDTPQGLGTGFNQDYRTYRPAERDTFKLKVWWPFGQGYPLQFAWSAADSFFQRRDTVLISDETGRPPINMGRDSVLTLTDSTNMSLLITVGPSVGTGVPFPPHPFPYQVRLFQNYPNPFNSTTTVGYSLPAYSHVTLGLYDLLGQRIKILVNEVQTPGFFQVHFVAGELASGVYLFQLTACSQTLTKAMLLQK